MKALDLINLNDCVEIKGFKKIGPCKVIKFNDDRFCNLMSASNISVKNVERKDIFKISSSMYLEAKKEYLKKCQDLLQKYKEFKKSSAKIDFLEDENSTILEVKRNSTINSNIRKILIEISKVESEISKIK